jgi:hypothetical protein
MPNRWGELLSPIPAGASIWSRRRLVEVVKILGPLAHSPVHSYVHTITSAVPAESILHYPSDSRHGSATSSRAIPYCASSYASISAPARTKWYRDRRDCRAVAPWLETQETSGVSFARRRG